MEHFKRQIEARIAEGVSLAQLERTLLRSLAWLDEERQAALWLYAWLLSSSRGGPMVAAPRAA